MKKTVKKMIQKDLTTEVFNLKGEAVEQITLPREIFASSVSEKLLAQAVRVYLANQRQGTSSTKTRGEVAGSTRKIYRQKGTGRARHGSIKAPIFVGGGIIFGPKPRDYSLKLPQKMKNKALTAALTNKFKNHQVLIVDNLEKLAAKTKKMMEVLKNLNLETKQGKLLVKTLLVAKTSETLLLACRNIENLTMTPPRLLHPYLVLAHKKIILTRDAIEVLCKTPKS